MTAVARLHDAHPERISNAVKGLLRSRVQLTEPETADLWAHRDALVAGLQRWLHGQRALMLPVSIEAPHDLTGRLADFQLLSPSRAISLFGVPAVSVPVATSRTGSPISVQIVAPAFREDIALAICERLSQQFRPVAAAAQEAWHAR
jgi:Asp-tRNA(Asn)/Glu-tRNA(Gln) amidotransferase A subunit family amidase